MNLLNMEEERAIMALDKFIRENPHLVEAQIKLEQEIRHITDPEKRLEILVEKINIQQELLAEVFARG